MEMLSHGVSRKEEAQMGIFWSEVTGALLSLERAYVAQLRGLHSWRGPAASSAQLSCHSDKKTEPQVWGRCIKLHVLRLSV